MLNLQLMLYDEMLKQLKLGFRDGKAATSKPVYVLSIIESINDNQLTENKIYFNNENIKTHYKEFSERYKGQITTPFLPFFIRPFYHLSSEPFYSLIWKDDTVPPPNSHTPSAKYLRENLEYAKLDDDLWELLQDSENRAYLKQTLVKTYLNETTPS